MEWYGRSTRTAAPVGHGDTLNGQMMEREVKRLYATITELRGRAASGELTHVMPRWRGELRRRILMLPSPQRLPNMSMYELREVAAKVNEIQATATKYGYRSDAEN